MEQKPDYITLKVTNIGEPENGKRRVKLYFQTGFNILHNQLESGGYDCYIPSYDIYFNADKLEDIPDISQALTSAFVKHILKNEGLEKLLQQLRVLKFNPTDDLWANVVKRKDFAKERQFNKPSSLFKIPTGFKNATALNGKLDINTETIAA